LAPPHSGAIGKRISQDLAQDRHRLASSNLAERLAKPRLRRLIAYPAEYGIQAY
jgi:hypothetical protein